MASVIATPSTRLPEEPPPGPGRPATFRRAWQRLRDGDLLFLIYLLIFIVLTFLIIYPIVLLMLASFQVGDFGAETQTGLDNWRAAISSPRIRSAIWNTTTLTATHVTLSTAIALAVAWLVARTDLPGKGWLEFGFWIAYFLPTLTVILAWILMFAPEYGVVNAWLADVPFLRSLQFDIFSWRGIVLGHLVTTGIAIKVMLLTPLLRNTDPSLEEAASVAGASRLTTLRRIVFPTVLPGILIVVVIAVIKAIEAFELELILGATQRIDVFSTLLYRFVQQQPPQYGSGTALAMIMLFVLIPIVLLQQYISANRRSATITGKYTVRIIRLGRAKWACFAFVFGLVLVLAVLPAAVVVMGTFMKIFGFFDLPEPWTLQNWRDAFADPNLLRAFRNTLWLGIGSVLISVVVFTLVAYLSSRTRYRGRGLLDLQTWLPTVMPGIVMGLGFLWLFLNVGFLRALYGSMWVLIVAIVFSMITIGIQVIKSNMVQLGNELEEAAWVAGAGRLLTIRKVVMPPIAPAIAVVMVLVFASAVRATSPIVLLTVRSTETLSITQLQYMESGHFAIASVIGVALTVIVLAVALVARLSGLKLTVNG